MPTPYAKHEDQGRLLTLPPFFIISAFISLIFSQFFAKILNFPGNSCIRAHSSEHSDQADVMSMLALALLYTGYVRGKRGSIQVWLHGRGLHTVCAQQGQHYIPSSHHCRACSSC